MEKLNQDFLEFIKLLESNRVQYLIVGGYAVGVHGFLRYTGDIDFFVAIREENAARVLAVFEQFGFGGIGLKKDDFLRKDFVVEIGREPKKIQVLTGIDGVSFDECYERYLSVDCDGLQMKCIGLEDLIKNKKASGRAKDLIDVEELSAEGNL